MAKLTVFLSHGGKAVWKSDESGSITESTIKNEYLDANGIYTKKIICDSQKNIAWIQVDSEKTNIKDFYTWDEVSSTKSPQKPECWRDFYFFRDENDGHWWSPKGIQVDADIQDLGNIGEVYEVALKVLS